MVGCWRGYLSGARCRLAYCPADATVSFFSKIQIGCTFLVPAHPGSPGQGPLNGLVCFCMYVDNYWAIAISNAETKLLETVILQYVNDVGNCDMYQFGFKKSHSTGLCTSAVKRTVDYYVKRGSYVYACFIDFHKAFDMVNYWKLFVQMLGDGTDLCFVKLLTFLYSVFIGSDIALIDFMLLME